MSDFVSQVREALGAIPHGANCPEREQVATVGVNDTPITITFTQGLCNCDREERIAQRVAAAIEAGLREVGRATEWGGFDGDEFVKAGSDAALRSFPEPDTERPT